MCRNDLTRKIQVTETRITVVWICPLQREKNKQRTFMSYQLTRQVEMSV